jgi:DNA-binding SARP family transcriptional activator/tetratricopeptide (TPR) repeat protein
MVHLSTLGPVVIHVGKKRLTAASQRAFAALFYLVVERGKEIPRRTLDQLLFPDPSKAIERHSLRQLLYRLRQMGVPLDGDSPTVTLASDAATWDVEVIESHGGYSDAELDALSHGYLSGFTVGPSPAFNEWLDMHRTTVTATLRRGLLTQMREEKAKHHFAGVDRAARACLALDPLNEEATLATAEVLVMSGSKTEALSVLDRYIDEVGPRSRDLRVAPKLLRERISEYVVDSGLLAEPPLVGRDQEMATLRALLCRIGHGGAEACVLWGSSGIGKSRLLNEACSIGALQGMAIVRCALQPHDQRRPLAVLRDMGPRLLDLPGALGCSPEALALVRGLCGRGEMPARELPRTTQDSEVALAAALASATDLLDAVCGEGPVLLCIEDAHWLDPASIELIVEAVAGQRSLCILMASQRALQLPQRLANAACLSSIEVPRLPADSSALLMRRLFERAGRAPDGDFVEGALGLADGVPFYLQSLFVEYATTGDRTAIPSTLTASLASKLERLGETTRSVFDAIVVLGKQCTLGRLEALVQLPRHSLLTSLRELEERGLTRSTPNVVSCAHELFAVTARGKMPASVSRMLHRAIAEILENNSSDGGAEPWDIAAHWQASGDPARGLSVILRCAEEAIHIGRPQEAIVILSRMAKQPTGTDRRQILEAQLAAYEAAGEWPSIVACVTELLGLLRDDEGARSRTLELRRIGARLLGGATAGGDETRLRELMSTEQDKNDHLQSVMLNLIVAENSVDNELALEALAAVERIGHDTVAGMIPYMTYHIQFGSLEEAGRTAVALQAAIATDASSTLRFRAECNTGVVLFTLGEVERAATGFQRAYQTASEIGLQSGQIISAIRLAFLYWCADDHVRFETWYRRTAQDIERSTVPSQIAGHFSNGILRALDAGRASDAKQLLAEAHRRAPNIAEGRRRHLGMAYELRIELATGARPSNDQIDALLRAYCVSKGFLAEDVIVDTLVGALRSRARDVEAEALRTEFLRKWRRDRYPIPPRLTNLREAIG